MREEDPNLCIIANCHSLYSSLLVFFLLFLYCLFPVSTTSVLYIIYTAHVNSTTLEYQLPLSLNWLALGIRTH